MFAKLKKKIEDEVGDLGQITSPLGNPFGAASDRRVGGSSQGSNTPNNLGSRQSSVTSLVDLHPVDERSPSNSSLSVPSTKTSNSAVAARQKQQESNDMELKKINTEWSKKVEAMKKFYEDRIQNQEADFAWKYSTKDDELERVRTEKKKLEETVKHLEGMYQNKMTRVQDDMDQLEGFTKQEMAKVKHLLLNTQADLQKTKGDLIESESKVKEISEENRNLKAENDSILRNLDRDRLQRVKFDFEHGDTKTQFADLQNSKQQLENEVRTMKEDILSKNKKIDELEKQSQHHISEKQGEIDAFERRYSDLESDLAKEKARVSDLSHQVSEFQNYKVQLENEIKVLQEEILSKNIIVTHMQEQVTLSNSERLKESNKLQSLNLELKNELELFKNDLKSKESEIQQLQLQHQNLHLNTTDASEEISKLTKSNQELESQIKSLSEDLQSKKVLIKEYSELNDEITAVRNSNEKLEREVQVSSEEKASLVKQLEEHVFQKSESKNEIMKIHKQVTDLNAAALTESINRADLLAQIEGLLNSKLELETQIKQLNSEFASSKQEFLEKLNHCTSEEQADSTVIDLQQQVSDLTKQIKLSKSTESALLSQISELRNSNLDRDNQITKLNEDVLVNEQQKVKMQEIIEISQQSHSKIVNAFQQRIFELETQLEKYTHLGEEHSELLIQINELKNSKLLLGNEVLKLKDGIKLRIEKCEELAVNSDKFVHKISDLESELSQKTLELVELSEVKNSKVLLESEIIQLNEEIHAKQEKIVELQEVSFHSDKETELLHHTLKELEVKLIESNERTTDIQFQLDSIRNLKIQQDDDIVNLRHQLKEKDQNFDTLQNKLKSNSIREEELLQKIQSSEMLRKQLENQVHELSVKSSPSKIEEEFQLKIRELEAQLKHSEHDASEHNDMLVQVGELQSTKDELEEEIKFLKEEVQVRDIKISALEDKNAISGISNSNSSTTLEIQNESEDIESLRERIRELESQLGDKNKALKLRQQQLQDLRKSLAKEIRNTPGDTISKSASQTSLRELEMPIRSQEYSYVETEPAVIQSSNSHSTEASNCSTEDVNFQYMRSVIFKYVTSSDPQMTHHLTKVVSTLLHLNDEEQRLLQRSTDRRLVSWLGTRENIL